ncbi:DUF3095 family protein [Aridibaculum aurantiacum]|uniref:DUF3095 family protein n=1 Tax=Aridibaculum aurantiacum TaxID=2810307 RepID=UPI001A9661E5|nr:DUF3095 family protein [Aridibaculum aurantiacum]
MGLLNDHLQVYSNNFYKNLPTSTSSLHELFRSGGFVDVPDDWHVIIADVKNSTAAVSAGNHNDVNLVAASSLVVALNIAKDAEVEIPFFFTGDGGTVFVPPVILNDVLKGLQIHNNNSIQNFNIELHSGSLSIASIKEAGHAVRIAKVRFGNSISKAVVIGDGLQYAEKIIKGAGEEKGAAVDDPALLNMEGLECRWDKIKPIAEDNEVVCYLIEAVKPSLQAEVYADVLQKMDEIYGAIENRNPISFERLKLMLSVNKIKKEMMVRFGRWKRSYLISTFLKTFIGKLYFKFNWKVNNLRGQEYLKQVITNADILTIDGRINTIISATRIKHSAFVAYLDQQEQIGRLVFGHFTSRESVMTCYIGNRNENHIHFVDGADGGYTEAAKELKGKKRLSAIGR